MNGQILIVEDDPAFLSSVIVPVFAERFSLTCADNVPRGHEALDHLRHLVCALVDLNIPGGRPFSLDEGTGGGFEIARRVRKDFPSVPCVIITAHTSDAVINAAHRCGAELIAKDDCLVNLELLLTRLENRTRSAFARWQQLISRFCASHGLSARQCDVLELAAYGHSYQDIADRLRLSTHTVKSHVRHILAKSGYRSIKDIVAEWSER